jgi:hypothetical protein
VLSDGQVHKSGRKASWCCWRPWAGVKWGPWDGEEPGCTYETPYSLGLQ